MSEINADDNDVRWFDFQALIIGESDKAIRLAAPEHGLKPFWLPKSQVERLWYADDTGSREIRKGKQIVQIELPWWLAKENGIV